ncbi:MAG: ABC transporter ATP-binding protein [Spirochaetaceae bacterium]|nr:MAG: ABC transporter ATP-binding protein [Spirochaetaceae bacterium]
MLREDERVITGYNPRVVRRLLAYLRPYRVAVILALIALTLSTAAEILLPVILQRSVDRHMVSTARRVAADRPDEHELLDAVAARHGIRIGDFVYLLEVDLNDIAQIEQRRLRDSGVLSERGFTVTRIDQPQALEVVERYPTRFERSEVHAAIDNRALADLSADDRRALRSDDIAGVQRMSVFFFGLLIMILMTSFVQVYLIAYAGQGVMKDMRLQLYDHTIRQSLAFLNTQAVGKLVTRLTNDVETINELFTNTVISLLKNITIMIGVIVAMFALNTRMALVTAATLPPVIVLTLIFRKKARDAFRRVRQWVSKVNAYLAEHISGMSVVQMFVRERKVNREFQQRNGELMRASLAEMYVFATFRPLVDLLSSVSLAAIVYFGARFLAVGVVSLGILIAFIDLAKRFYQQLMDISDRFVVLQSAMAGSERVFELLDTVDRVEDSGTIHLPRPVRGELRFESVSFAYRSGEPVLRDISFRVPAGQTVAIVGYTGAGKTTIANLVTRLWDVDGGTVRLDGVDVRDIPLGQLRSAIQPIQQDVFLFNDTVAENIRLGADISDQKVVEAARIVQADRFISALPRGYQTILEEGAANISTGQRQLIAFARVLAHDPRVIILDEATASIDTETEALIQTGIRRLLAGRTSLVIAHRLSTIKNADRILVLSAGGLAEDGTHEELLVQRGLYFNLYRLQYQQ